MEAITLGFALGAGAVLLARNGRKRAKVAIGWAARQAGWIAGRIRSDISAAKNHARDEFERERAANPAPAVDVVVPSERVAHAERNGNGARPPAPPLA
jgi:hypothetical protein